jgi:hypothetical protein
MVSFIGTYLTVLGCVMMKVESEDVCAADRAIFGCVTV